jgi:Zn-dependent metalloprotease
LRLSNDTAYSADIRRGLAEAAQFDIEVRKLREQSRKVTRASSAASPAFAALAAAPSITVNDCRNSMTLPGLPIANPGTSADGTVKRAFGTTEKVVKFYKQVFGRNSIDDAAMTLVSSVHYGMRYNNAFWDGSQMAYGDGDGAIFVDFTLGDDVVCHELTHGVTQHSLQLVYRNESGGLNESMSDVFGSMFRQWSAGQDVTKADWLIGKDIVGPQAVARGLTCLRDMAHPDGVHCLGPQIVHFSDYRPGMDPHESSGVPNLAFYNAAMAIGGNSWDKAGQIWYNSMTAFGASPNMRMNKFADRTRQVAVNLFPTEVTVATAVDQAWKGVGL